MSKILLKLRSVVLLLITASFTYAQGQIVSGKVTSGEDGGALPGVNVVIKGSALGTVTDVDGTYKLTVPTQGSTLTFSFIGFQSTEVEIGDRTVIDVSLSADVTQLSEVVVTGYGQRSANSFTGSAVTMDKSKFQNIPVTNLEQSLQGNVAGLQLSASSGTPGSSQEIRIRGLSSINASNEPLFVIDGIPMVTGNNQQTSTSGNLGVLSAINANDIESLTVLKDAGATALYGARGSNGVIIITTKKGKEGKPVIDFSAQYGSVDRATAGPKMLNAAQWDELYYESLVNRGYYTDIADARANDDSGWDGVTNTDWRDVVKNNKAITQSYDLSIRGGNDKSNYYVSFGYMQQDGVNIGSNYERISGKVAFSQKVGKKFSISNTLTPSYVSQLGQLEGSAYFSNPDAAYLFTWSTDKPTNADGTPNLNLSTSTYNPLYTSKHDIYQRLQTRVLNATTATYDITDKLKFSSIFGVDYLSTEGLTFNNKNYGDGFNAPNDPLNGATAMYVTRNFNYDFKNMLDYSYSINEDHKLDFKIVYEAQKNFNKITASGGQGFAADDLYYTNSVGTINFGSGAISDWSINSILGLVNYTFKGNIFVDATVRREGNSRFSKGNRWGTFYSFGTSWVFSDEKFMSGIQWLNTSKIRASIGKTGNAGIGLNEYQATLSFGNSYNGEAGATPGQLGNQNLSWENQIAYNLAIDFGIFKRITGTVEYFNRRTYDLLLNVPLSGTTGFSTQRQNLGEMVNKGFEFSLNADLISTEKFRWNVGMNFTMLDNEVTDLPVDGEGNEIGITTSTTIITKGQPANAYKMRKWAGVDPQTGSPLWYKNGIDGETTSTYSAAELALQGGSPLPTKFGGINTRIEYKGIYLSGNLYASYGNKAYDSWASYTQSDGRYTFSVANAYARQYDRWQKPGDIAPNPKNVYGNTSSSNAHSTRRLYDAGFVRLRNVNLGYNFPASLLSKIKISTASIYVMGTNLWTKTKDPLMEFDPEVQASGTLSLNAPPLKTMVMGVKIGF